MKKYVTLFLMITLLVSIPNTIKAETSNVVYTDEDYDRLHAVINHVENILHYGHAYNEETKLLPDAINTLTGEPARWVFPNRAEVPYANLANQQNFFRTLVGLSKVTGSDKYELQAKEIVGYFMDNYQNPNGLFNWGGHRAINLDNLEVQSTEGPNGPHELKNMMPFYELMLEVDEEKTTRFMKQLWTAHFYWDSQNMNRHGSYSTAFDQNVFGAPIPEDVIKMDEQGNPIIPDDSPGLLPFVNSATDLAYAALTLSNHTGDPVPKQWAEYLMRQYNLASNPVTGMTVYQFKSTAVTKSAIECANPAYTNSGCGDRVARQFRDFGPIAREANVAWKNTQAVYVDNILMLLEAGDKYGMTEFVDWSRQYLEGYLDYAYIRVDGQNKIIPMFIDGTLTYGYVVPEVGYFGPSNMRLDYVAMPTSYLLPILRTIVQTKQEDSITLWNHLRDIMHAFGLGDIGPNGGLSPNLNLDTSIDDPFALMTMVELYDLTKNPQYLDSARTIGNNIVREKFHRGFFVDSEIMLYSRLDQPDTLALLSLDAVIRGIDLENMPFYLADSGYIHGYLLADDGVTEDRSYTQNVIYTKTIYDWE
ncbi:Exopolygalacturonate lyase [Paracholeplasma brassicae]|uniref:Exopolygalacturonate lyase n=1 Tax=Acholeplasma brassicae TaxID=61635 RepID=U4KME7_9MOLU|nr:exopolygalacturonate lyase [Paracholeplasma brassicae]CCV65307.1 Exopolygalacturonate lyase [Paracholeplasma brassicae]